MNRMQKDDKSGDLMFINKPKTQMEKTNQTKMRVIVENQNVALVNLRKSIEK